MLANEVRPTTFEQTVGQDHLAQILINAGKRRVFQVMLFAGPSGTGKTTFARLAASHYGVQSADYSEMDAASNSSVDNIRQLQEQFYSLPVDPESVYKAIVIDEAHGLSKAAQDALLKVAEEPPAHLLLFLCTTDPFKLSETLRSRCLWLPFRSLSLLDIVTILENACAEYRIGYERIALAMIAGEAGGNARKALSMLDYFTTGWPLNEKNINLITGSPPWNEVRNFVETLLYGNAADALAILARFQYGGVNPSAVIGRSIQYMSDMWKYKLGLDVVVDDPELANKMSIDVLKQISLATTWTDLEIAASLFGEINNEDNTEPFAV